MKNKKIRDQAKTGGIHLWQIADKLGISDGNFSRKLRKELPVAEQARIFAIIQELKEDSDAANENN